MLHGAFAPVGVALGKVGGAAQHRHLKTGRLDRFSHSILIRGFRTRKESLVHLKAIGIQLAGHGNPIEQRHRPGAGNIFQITFGESGQADTHTDQPTCYVRHCMRILLLLAFALLAVGADLKPVYPSNAAKPIGPYTPGISAGGYVYVSGQGARDAAGNLPATFEEQTRQCLKNVQAIVEAAGLTMQHVVWAQVFIADRKNLNALEKVYGSFFAKDPPARSAVVVRNMPGETPVEIAVVALRDLKQRKPLNLTPPRGAVSDAVQTDDRVYVSGVLGIDPQNRVPKQPRAQVKLLTSQISAVLAKAGLEMRHMAYAHVYVDNAMPMKLLGQLLTETLPSETALTVTQTAALPRGAHIEISGIASRDATRQGDCSSVGETLYCPSAAGTIEQALNRIKANMDIAKLDLSRIVATNVFLDDITEFQAMNKIYAGAFGKWLPTRVTLQPTTKGDELNLAPGTDTAPPKPNSPRAQITVIAVR